MEMNDEVVDEMYRWEIREEILRLLRILAEEIGIYSTKMTVY
jgi:hypothetical protein